VVHGGKLFTDTTLITEDVKRQIAELSPLAPLHNRIIWKVSFSLKNFFLLPGK
jgi:acetate kinase